MGANRRGVVPVGSLTPRHQSLFGGGQVVDVLIEGLVVLALDLQFGLELFDEELEASDFGFELYDVGTGRWSAKALRRRCFGRHGSRRKGFGESAGPYVLRWRHGWGSWRNVVDGRRQVLHGGRSRNLCRRSRRRK